MNPGEQSAFEHWYQLHHQPDPGASMFRVVEGQYYWEQVRSEFDAFMGGVALGRELELARAPVEAPGEQKDA